jgi:hypothetical protein
MPIDWVHVATANRIATSMSHKATSTVPPTVPPGPFVRIIYGAKKELFVNLNCSVLSFMRCVT